MSAARQEVLDVVALGLRTVCNSIISDDLLAEQFVQNPKKVLLKYPVEDALRSRWIGAVDGIADHLATVGDTAKVPVFESLVDIVTTDQVHRANVTPDMGPEPRALLPVALANVLVVANIAAVANGAMWMNANVFGHGVNPANSGSLLDSLQIEGYSEGEVRSFLDELSGNGLSYARQMNLMRRVVKDGRTIESERGGFTSSLEHTMGTICVSYTKDADGRVFIESASIN